MDPPQAEQAMTRSAFESLEAAIVDEHFPDVDLMLRRGRHIGRDDGTSYEYLIDAQALLEELYRRFGCELVHRSEGYFYLQSSSDRLGRRRLTRGEMLVGQTLALLYLDPAVLQHGLVVTREVVLQRLSGLIATDLLVRTLNPRRRKYDERIAAETVRTQVAEALRRLSDLGFIDLLEETRLRLRPALVRFADPVRGVDDQQTAMAQLIAVGDVVDGDRDDDEADATEADDDLAEDAT
jgi:chromosome partition protein MukE